MAFELARTIVLILLLSIAATVLPWQAFDVLAVPDENTLDRDRTRLDLSGVSVLFTNSPAGGPAFKSDGSLRISAKTTHTQSAGAERPGSQAAISLGISR